MPRFIHRTTEALRADPRTGRRLLALATGWIAMAATAWFVAGTPRLYAQPAATGAVTPVVGQSWLAVQGLALHDSAMCWTGKFGPSPADSDGWASQPGAGKRVGQSLITIRLTAGEPGHPFTMTGKDLYRLNCQSCHGEKGEGRPPEINSLVDPIQGASLAVTMQRLQQSGAPVNRAFAEGLVKTGEQTLEDRLVNGGKKMPPFRRLSTQEVKALRAYLDLLAGIPGAENSQITVVEPYNRAGELLVKGTCHICHDATGPGKDPELLMENVRPSLVSLVKEDSLALFVQKVTAGAPIAMGTPPLLRRGRMPVFYYISQDEAAAAYHYLSNFRPQPRPGTEKLVDAYAH